VRDSIKKPTAREAKTSGKSSDPSNSRQENLPSKAFPAYIRETNRMARKASSKPESSNSTATIGFEAKLWLTADKLRNNMDAAEYKHVVLGLIFLKYISDTFEEHRAKLLAGEGDYTGTNAEDPDEYKAENVFWVPAEARWSHLQANAKQPTVGMSNAEVRMTNRSRFTSTFEIQQSKFA
jgi:type I restriction-modification system DNA methylase subunit